ncbi:MAG: hypothetical protein A3K09_00690 [Nitrospinae bacterium RIFCSPLOWO2_12_FULL_47_7]|nr:MAG: hypothetical protein A3K09_00690 [Nitrospinae bacterium RIFCSPLOWO2_12_FULL_47_7]
MLKRMARVLLTVLPWIFAVGAAVAEQNNSLDGIKVPDPVAKVNGVPLSSNFVLFEFNRMMKNIDEALNEKQKTSVLREIIDTEVVRELMYQEGKVRKLDVPSEKIDEEFKKLKSGYNSESDFMEALKQRKITLEELKKSIELDFLARQLLDEQVKGKVAISDQAVQKFYDDNKERFLRPESYRAQHIFVSIYPAEMLEKHSIEELESKKENLTSLAETKMSNIYKELKGGGDFAELAKKYSDDAGSSSKGGDLDFIYKGIFDPAFDEAVSKLHTGETSGVVKTPYGFHIIKLNESRPSEHAQFSEVKESIQKHLFMDESKRLAQEYIVGLKKKAKVEILF